MTEIIIVLFFACIVLFLSSYRAFRPLEEKRKRHIASLPEETLIGLLREKGKSMRRYDDSGEGVSWSGDYDLAKKAERMLTRKVKDGVPLSDAEKWYYENFYLVERFVFSKRNTFTGLPHVDGVPRVVIVARLIADGSTDDLTPDRCKRILKAVRHELNFTYRELCALGDAMIYAFIENVYMLAGRLLYDEECRFEARKKKLNEKYLERDVYVYYCFFGEMNQDKREKMERLGYDESETRTAYHTVALKNATIARTFFTALADADSYLPRYVSMRFSPAYAVLARSFPVDNVADETLSSYLAMMDDLAMKTGCGETYVAKKAVEYADKYKIDVSTVLLDGKTALKRYIRTGRLRPIRNADSMNARAYAFAIFALSGALAAGLGYLTRKPLVCALSYVPLVFLVENCIGYLLSLLSIGKVVPRMNYDSVSHDRSTMVVVSEAIDSVEQLKKAIFHAKTIYAGNRDGNIVVGLLIDTKSADTAISDADREIVEYLENTPTEDGLSFFIRKKSYDGKKFVAKERKRGALMALVKYLVTGEDFEFYYIKRKAFFTPAYVVLLDADNTVIPGEILRAVNVMAHPYNDRYDMMTFGSRTDLYSLSNAYALQFAEEGGFERYPVYSDFYNRFFGTSVFCGKGIVRLRRFYNALDSVFPTKKILSHDILEGSVLHTAYGGTCFEEAPKSFVSDRERRRRWERGDVQLLPFLFGRWKTDDGSRCKKDLSAVGKFVIVTNALRLVKEASLFALLSYGAIAREISWYVAITLFLAPYVWEQIKIVRANIAGVRPGVLVRRTARNLFRIVEDFFLLGFYAVDKLILLLVTLAKMLLRKNLLTWKTYSASQKEGNIYGHLRLFAPSVAVLTTLAATSFFFGLGNIGFPLYVCGFFVIGCMLYVRSAYKIDVVERTEKDREYLQKVAENTYKYFRFMRRENGLIADNLQIKPYKGEAGVTSPTDLGFGLLADICACEIGLISAEECTAYVARSIDAIINLEKCEGNLYNWYDVRTGKRKNDFVSSVDNGNLLACLLVAQAFFAERGESAVVSKIIDFIAGFDLSKLFDENKHLFYIGKTNDKPTGHYDLLASESRILSFLYAGLYGDKKIYYSLLQDFSPTNGGALLSWGGTAFETLMPDLFFISPRTSVLRETALWTVRKQKKRRLYGVWGISESGYYAFDEDWNYQYASFGVKNTALNRDVRDDVVAPYACALALPYDGKSVVKNMRNLSDEGMTFEYGFYESMDCSSGRKIVRSAMTHHQGMILASIVNYLRDGILRKYFTSDPAVASTLAYCNDRHVPTGKASFFREKRKKYRPVDFSYRLHSSSDERSFCAYALSDGKYSVVVNRLGGGYSRVGDVFLTYDTGVMEENNGIFFFLSEDGLSWKTPSFLPCCHEGSIFETETDGKEIIIRGNDRTECVTLLYGGCGEVRKVNASEKDRFAAMYFSVQADGSDDYFSHPVFRDLFVNAQAVRSNVLVLEKRLPDEKGSARYVCVRVEGLSEIEWECNRLNFIGRGNRLDASDFLYGKKNGYVSTGDVLTPCVGVKGKLTAKDHVFQVSIRYGTDKITLIRECDAIPEDMYGFALQGAEEGLTQKTQEILGVALYARYPSAVLKNASDRGKTKDFIDFTERKKLFRYVWDGIDLSGLKTTVRSLAEVKKVGANVGLLLYSERELTDAARREAERLRDAFGVFVRFVYGEKEEKDWFLADITGETPLKTPLFSYSYPHELNTTRRIRGETDRKELVFETGDGGFDEEDRYVVRAKTRLPYADVIGHTRGGAVITDEGNGFYWFGNSREEKCVRFDNDLLGIVRGENLYLKTSSGVAVLNGGAMHGGRSVFAKGYVIKYYEADGFTSAISDYFGNDGDVKITEVCLRKRKGSYAEFIYAFYPCLGSKYDPTFTFCHAQGDFVCVRSLRNDRALYVRVVNARESDLTFSDDQAPVPYLEYVLSNEEERFYICSSYDLSLLLSLEEDKLTAQKEISAAYYKRFSGVYVSGTEKPFSYLVNMLPYQVLSSRLNARAGFYQVGGAIGFRDQLQDALAFYDSPEILKERIVQACLHQYEEGDVMHWWHEPNRGLRTRVTDDKLFLPYAVVEYVRYTQDESILEEEYPYLKSAPLLPSEHDRYEAPPYTSNCETVRLHCIKAIRSALRFGEHRLLIMGAGDWNDGMNAIGKGGIGESVFNSMFCSMVLTRFSAFCPKELSEEMMTTATELKKAINVFAFQKDRYARLYSDDGRWLGQEDSPSFCLDILVQAAAVLCDVADGERAKQCLDTSRKLIDRGAGVIKLLMPPQTRNDRLGYISDYPKGVRENGGQYTHAAIWYLMALTKMGRCDEAYELFDRINPVKKCSDPEKAEQYMGEPYVLSADVYTNPDHFGRCGWTWYTGSAAWAYKLVTEWFYGLQRKGDRLYFEPHLPKKLEGSILLYRYKNSTYILEYRFAERSYVRIEGAEYPYLQLEENVRKNVTVQVAF